MADIPVRRDLTVELGEAEVCTLADGRCVRGRRAAELHDLDEVGTRPLFLPAGTSTNLYLRLPTASRIAFEFRAVDAAVRLEVTAAGAAPALLFVSGPDAADDRWRPVEVAIGLAAGTIVRLRFAVEPLVPGRPALAMLQRPVLHARRPPPPQATGPALQRPNVLVYVVDTLRADRLGCYGHAARTSPRIDAFAAEAVRFTDAVAQSSWTRPSTASIFTGRVPPRHGALEADTAIRPDVPTLPELLHAAGWTTAAFVTNSVVSAPFGFARGFDRFHYFPEAPGRADLFLPADRVVRPVARWLRRAPRPFFLYVHVADPHNPYVPPARYRRGLVTAHNGVTPAAVIAEQRRCPDCLHELGLQRPAPIAADTVAVLSELYDAEVARADLAFGRVLDVLRARGRLDDTLVVFTADHGEEFLEHGGVTHGKTLYRELLHVPLLARLPGGRRGGTSVSAVVQHADLLPSILDFAGLPSPPGLDGEPILRDDGPPAGREVFSHLAHDGRTVAAITDERWGAIRTLAAPEGTDAGLEIYDLHDDAGERRNLVEQSPILAAYATLRLRELLARREAPGPAVDRRQLDRLRALGYVTP